MIIDTNKEELKFRPMRKREVLHVDYNKTADIKYKDKQLSHTVCAFSNGDKVWVYSYALASNDSVVMCVCGHVASYWSEYNQEDIQCYNPDDAHQTTMEELMDKLSDRTLIHLSEKMYGKMYVCPLVVQARNKILSNYKEKS